VQVSVGPHAHAPAALRQALRDGLPIATGVIEGACRYLVKDRMDRTGARWGLTSAEAVLRLRALRTSGDFDAYWQFHLERERERNHTPLYEGGSITDPLPPTKRSLRRVISPPQTATPSPLP